MKSAEDIREIAIEVAQFLDNKKAQDVRLIDLQDRSPITDFFLIASGEVQTQLESLNNYLIRFLKEKGYRPINTDKGRQEGWILLDYSDFVVHLFMQELREFYNLDRVWGECNVVWPKE